MSQKLTALMARRPSVNDWETIARLRFPSAVLLVMDQIAACVSSRIT
jgi:hypothetical protein